MGATCVLPSVASLTGLSVSKIDRESLFSFQGLARLAIFLNLFIPFLTFGLIYRISIETSPQFAFCVGNSYYNFLSTDHKHCSLYENMFIKAACHSWTYLLMFLMSNIFDIIFVYFCAKAIEDQTEASKDMISKNEYVIRRRYVHCK